MYTFKNTFINSITNHLIRKSLICLSFFTFFVTSAYCQETPTIRIGVLAKRGKDTCLHRWTATAEYLTVNIPKYQFQIVPLSFDEVEKAVISNDIHFLFANSAIYTDLSIRYSLERISTVKRLLNGTSQTFFGGVVFTRSSNEGINSFNELKGCSFAAVNKHSLGGWIVAWREFMKDDISPEDDFSSLSFLGTHDKVVDAVLKGDIDAGTVRTDTLERMATEDKIKLSDVKILKGTICQPSTANHIKSFPFRLSTRLYPEWPIAKLVFVSDELAEEVALFLMKMPRDCVAAKNAQITGWTIPKNYREVDRAFQVLNIGVYAEFGDFSFMDIYGKYRWILVSTGLIFIMMLLISLYILRLNSRLKKSEEYMRVMSTHDALTGLPNRNLFMEFSEKALALGKRENKSIAILFIDLDFFKQVNDTYGHRVGDELLETVGARLRSHLRKEDLIARVGGDEFSGLLYNVSSIDDLRMTASRIVDSISKPYLLTKENVKIGCSIGLSLFPDHGSDIKELLLRADQALYEVKKRGRGDFMIHGPCNG